LAPKFDLSEVWKADAEKDRNNIQPDHIMDATASSCSYRKRNYVEIDDAHYCFFIHVFRVATCVI